MTRLEIGLIEVDDAAAAHLLDHARRRGLSLQAAVSELIVATSRAQPEPESWLDRVNKIAAMTPKGIPQTDSTELLREIRNE